MTHHRHDSQFGDSRPGSKSESASAAKDLAGGVAATAAAAAATSIESFATNAMSAILYELKASDIALRRAHHDDVRSFARDMQADFGKMKSELGSFLGATESPTSPPDEPIKLHKTLLDDLSGASDKDFDHRYIEQQKLAHLEARTLFTSYERLGLNAGLQNLCRLGMPVLEQHVERLKTLEH